MIISNRISQKETYFKQKAWTTVAVQALYHVIKNL